MSYKALVISLKKKFFPVGFNRGFTIVELLIYIGVLGILLGVLTNVFSSVLDVNSESQTNATVQQDGRYILTRLSYDVHRAQSIVSPALGSSASNSLQLSINGVTYTYSLNNNNLVLTNDQGTDILSGYDANISGLTFQTVGNVGGKNSVQIHFTVTSKTARVNNQMESGNFDTTAGLR